MEVLVPVALEEMGGVVGSFLIEEGGHLGVAGFDLIAGGPTVVGEVVAAADIDGTVDDATKVAFGFSESGGGVIDVEVHDDAGPGFAGPGKERLIIFLDEADGSVDDLHGVLAEVIGEGVEKGGQLRAGDVDFGDHFGARAGGGGVAVDGGMIVVDVGAELVGIGPIDLAVGFEVERGVEVVDLGGVGVGEGDEFGPIGFAEFAL
jgi:hypothetical protein